MSKKNLRIEIIGNIASGKTTLALLLSRQFRATTENFRENPFWEAFYRDPVGNSFETEVTFTLQHYHQIKNLHELQSSPTVSDFSLWLDAAYAEVTLMGNRLNLYRNLHEELIDEVGLPYALIRLECDTETLMQRIQNRGRPQEKTISISYLAKIECEIQRQVARLNYEGVKIHTIDSSRYDFAHRAEDMESVTASIIESTSL